MTYTEFDAFTQGTTVGGMRTKNDLRILLCYILKNLHSPISKSGMDYLFQTTELANFFEVGDALSSLAKNGLAYEDVHEDGEKYYTLTSRGSEVAGNLETDIPLSTRKIAVKAALDVISREEQKRYTDASVTKLENGYNVVLTIRDQGDIMMQTVLYCADSLQASMLCERFMNDPGKLYGGIIDLLTGPEEKADV